MVFPDNCKITFLSEGLENHARIMQCLSSLNSHLKRLPLRETCSDSNHQPAALYGASSHLLNVPSTLFYDQ